MTDDRELDLLLDLDSALSIAISATKSAGVILREKLTNCEVREKSPNDLVTDADIAAQSAIETILLHAFPDFGFVGEEDASVSSDRHRHMDSEWQWVVDPLDGTTNFAHGLRNFCVSIALTYRRQSVLGVVFDPIADESYTAIRGRGAQLNFENIRPSGCTQLSKALVAASFPPRLNRQSPEIQQFLEVLLRCQSIRRLGSAALNLCFVAAGRLDAYWGGRLNAWDVAAASLVAEEAGASVSRHDGLAFDLDSWAGQVLAASSPILQQELIHCLNFAAAGPS